MAATAWRLTGIVMPQGQDLRVRAARVFADGTDVTASAEVSSSVPPVSGSLTDLSDDGSTECVWAAQQVRQPGFWIQWAFAAPVQVSSLQLDGVDCYAAVMGGGADALSVVIPGTQTGVEIGELAWSARNAISKGPVGYWSLTDHGASQPDEIGTRTGVRTGGAVVSAQIAIGGPEAFDPLGVGLIRVPNVAGIDGGAFTVVIDFQYTESANKVLLEHGSDNRGWTVQSTTGALANSFGGPAGCLMIHIGTSTDPWLTNIAVNDGKPHRLTLVVANGGAAVVYIDGINRTRRGGAGAIYPPAYNTAHIDVGSRGGVGGLADGGKLAHFALFDRALTRQEVADISSGVQWPIMARPVALTRLSALPPLPQGLHATSDLSAKRCVDMEFGGQGRFYGTVSDDKTRAMLQRRVRLHRSRDGMLVRETWSKADGSYAFTGINERYEYDIEAWDHEKNYFTTVANNQLPEVV